MNTDINKIIKDEGVLAPKNLSVGASMVMMRMPDQRGQLAKQILSVSMNATLHDLAGQKKDLIDVETLVTRAFDAADLFYMEAEKRGCMIDLPSQDEIVAADLQEKTRRAEEERSAFIYRQDDYQRRQKKNEAERQAKRASA